MSNRLANESSLYLRQHANNPVDWYPWGKEALARACTLERPIFLSIGYSACHWCHVMEHESFEDPSVAAILNEHFVSIKVDREERPDLDQIYMTAVQMLTRQGGWPMSMFLTPALKPFYGGTYFPPDDRYGRPSFRRVLLAVIDAWRTKRKEIEEQADDLTRNLQGHLRLEPWAGELGPELLQAAGRTLSHVFDARHGGFGQVPKFPHPMDLRLLLRLWKRFGDDNALSMVKTTLDHMALGGIYDQLGGGFHRYSTDAQWLVPHFEKMLYDNALLAVAYVEAFQATGEPFYREVVEETLEYVRREMLSPEGGFYSTQDADSEGEEGKFFVWTPAQIEYVLGAEEANLFAAVYDVTPSGNWEGHNILNRTRSYEQEAKLQRLPVEEMRRRLDESKKRLLEARGRRVWPGRDEKILTAWNGLMIQAFAAAGQALDRADYVDVAVNAARFVLTNLRTKEGRLLRTTSVGTAAKYNGYLEDYAYLLDALVTLYEATFDPGWIKTALELAGTLAEQFWDETEGGFFYTSKDHEALIARNKDPHDNATPSGNAMAVTGLLRLAKLTGRRDLQAMAEKTLSLYRGLMTQAPTAAGQMLIALDFHLGPVAELAIIGPKENVETKRVLGVVRGAFRPHKVVACKFTDDLQPDAEEVVPLLAKKNDQGGVTTYICRDFACQAPVVGAAALERALPR
ncbi:MAG: thioredoxin domain-containing protein [Gemmataceae bacterium]